MYNVEFEEATQGLRFGQKYIAQNGGLGGSCYIFYEDGSARFYYPNGEDYDDFDAGFFTYDEEGIHCLGSLFVVSDNGKTLTQNNLTSGEVTTFVLE